MSSTFGAEPATGSGFASGPFTRGGWRRGGRCGAAWTAPELLAMVAGFMIYWPIGLGIIGWKMLQRRGMAGEGWFRAMRGFQAGAGAAGGFGAGNWAGFGGTGNSAFDAWRAAEIERLEAERRKLEDAQRDFAAFVDEARRLRDKDEFERFMAARGRG